MEYVKNKTNILLYAMDETGMNLEPNNFYTWSPIGKPIPVIKNGNRGGLSFIGATEITTNYESTCIAIDKVDSDVVIAFFEYMKKLNPKKILMFILDNASIHISSKVKKYLKQVGNRIIPIQLPSYSPKLNPQENIWNQQKRICSQGSVFENKEQLIECVGDFYRWIASVPELVKKWVNWKLYFLSD